MSDRSRRVVTRHIVVFRFLTPPGDLREAQGTVVRSQAVSPSGGLFHKVIFSEFVTPIPADAKPVEQWGAK